VGVAAASLGLARDRHVGDAAVQLCVLGMVVVWGVRLSAHLAARQRGAPEDERYTAMLDGAAGQPRRRHPLRAIVLPQAALAFVVAMPVCAAEVGGRPRAWVLALGLGVYGVGLCFEAVGDFQLARFRADPGSSGRVLATGLWAWTRHPNYFGDAAVWWGVWLVAASTGLAWLTVLSPLTMTVLLTSVSGRPMLESSLARSKAGWDEYVARTSAFFPWPPRSG
ncbi:MAG TPA: DUF1295 domain-containing protein, partial [Acidimicrobiales bacterium]|nr:DUF1295 domain-containing protein [Acidimicrobiales bacterium]